MNKWKLKIVFESQGSFRESFWQNPEGKKMTIKKSEFVFWWTAIIMQILRE